MTLSDAIIKALGSDYKEEMTAEEVITALGNKKIVDLDKGGYVSESKYNSAISDKNKAEKALKTSQMSAEELREAELKAKDEKLAEVEKALNKAKAEKVFVASGVSEDDYAAIVDFVSPEQAVTLVGIINKTKEAAKQEAKEEAMRNYKSPTGGGTSPTKKWSEMSLDEKNKLYKDDPKEYERLKNPHT